MERINKMDEQVANKQTITTTAEILGKITSPPEAQVAQLTSASTTSDEVSRGGIHSSELRLEAPKLVKQDSKCFSSSQPLLLNLPSLEPEENYCTYRSRAIAKARMLQSTTDVSAPNLADILDYAQEVLHCTAELNRLGSALLQALLLRQKDKLAEIYKESECRLKELIRLNELMSRRSSHRVLPIPSGDNGLDGEIPDMKVGPSEHCIIVGYSPSE
ncbi:hypothetical protein TSMEX_008699 [Taenia solium]|eukprot:TsM_001036500 transcript=TsM_001036500 gene=TsM_001036500